MSRKRVLKTDTTWNPALYLTYVDERGRPFIELLARVRAATPHDVVDLGCGPGNLTALLAQRWPSAHVVGVDSSAEMIAAAAATDVPIEWRHQGVRAWATAAPAASVDVLVSNATLQWVPGHVNLLPALVRAVRPGGWLAFAVPGNFDEPSHTLRAELAGRRPYAEHLLDVDVPAAHDAATYLRTLQDLGCEVDAWETTYQHVLRGPDPVFTWVSATGARPTLAALPEELRERFATEYRAALAQAYPARGSGADASVVLPFRRVFVVART